jgi:copper(I)-binding protein
MNATTQWLLALLVAAHAGAAASAVFEVTEPWVRPAAAAASTEAYMELTSSSGATLVEVRSPVAARIALVTARKREPPPFALPLPPRTKVPLSAGRTWLVLQQLARPLKLGERVPMTLVVRDADGTTQEIEVDAEVRRRSPAADHHR